MFKPLVEGAERAVEVGVRRLSDACYPTTMHQQHVARGPTEAPKGIAHVRGICISEEEPPISAFSPRLQVAFQILQELREAVRARLGRGDTEPR